MLNTFYIRETRQVCTFERKLTREQIHGLCMCSPMYPCTLVTRGPWCSPCGTEVLWIAELFARWPGGLMMLLGTVCQCSRVTNDSCLCFTRWRCPAASNAPQPCLLIVARWFPATEPVASLRNSNQPGSTCRVTAYRLSRRRALLTLFSETDT